MPDQINLESTSKRQLAVIMLVRRFMNKHEQIDLKHRNGDFNY